MFGQFQKKFTNKLHHTLEDVSDFIKNALVDLTESKIKRICGFEYVFPGLYWTFY
jgi:hypothetical protein